MAVFAMAQLAAAASQPQSLLLPLRRFVLLTRPDQSALAAMLHLTPQQESLITTALAILSLVTSLCSTSLTMV